jgi:ribosomal-protein-alanine N-acetyltransferase
LVETALKIFKRYNVNLIKLEVRVSNDGAIKFYNEMGFNKKEILKKYYEDFEDAVLMEMDLDTELE